jgi:putative endonuclease
VSPPRLSLGRRGEGLAVAELSRRGYQIIERNWRCEAGEVDIVAREGPIWIFVEVRTRRSTRFGSPEESVTLAKQARMIVVAEHYLAEHGLAEVDWRLDLVAVVVNEKGQPVRVSVLQNAVQGC